MSIATESDNSRGKRAREYDVWIVEKLKKHKNCQADMERQDKVGLSHVGVLFGSACHGFAAGCPHTEELANLIDGTKALKLHGCMG